MERKSLLNLENKTLLILILVICILFCLLSMSMSNITFASKADEGYYLSYASYIANNGLSSFPKLFKFYLENKENWVYPNPLRIGFIILSALFVKIFGNSFFSLSLLSLFSFYTFLLISFYFIRKYFDEKIALLALILLAFSPLNMAMARRALMDATFNLFMTSSIWLFFESLKERKNIKTILFVLIYASTILIKENSVLLSFIFVFYIFIHRKLFRTPIKLMDFLNVTLFPFAIVGSLYVIMAGGIHQAINTIGIILNSPQSNQYAILFGSGPWFRYLIDFMLLSPWVFILSLGFFFFYFTKEEWQEKIFYLLTISVGLVILLNFFTKNVRYLIALDMPLRLFAVLMLSELTKRIFKKNWFSVLIISVIVIAFFDFSNFYNLFVKHSIYDPITYWLLAIQHIIPYK